MKRWKVELEVEAPDDYGPASILSAVSLGASLRLGHTTVQPVTAPPERECICPDGQYVLIYGHLEDCPKHLRPEGVIYGVSGSPVPTEVKTKTHEYLQNIARMKFCRDDSDSGKKPALEDRFTDRARKAVQLAHQEADYWQHEYLGCEHLLVGLVKEGQGVAGTALCMHLANVSGSAKNFILTAIRDLLQPGPRVLNPGHKKPKTPRYLRAIEAAVRISGELGHHYIGTEHLLLGLMETCEENTPVRHALGVVGTTPEKVTAGVEELLGACRCLEASGCCDVEFGDITVKVGDEVEECVLAAPAPVRSSAGPDCTCPSLLNGHLAGCPSVKEKS